MENSEFKPVKFRLKMDLVSYPARAEGLVNMKKKSECETKWSYKPTDILCKKTGYTDEPKTLLSVYTSIDINTVRWY